MEGTRFSHLVVNVTELERSADFLELATTLRRDARTPAPEQDFASLDLPRGRFDGWTMRDPGAPGGPAVHLVEWRSHRAHGAPYPMFWHNGLFRIATQHPDVPAHYDHVVAGGGRPFKALLLPEGENVGGRPCFSVPSPDGVVLQNITAAGAAARMTHVALNCADREVSREFYEALGLRAYREGHTTVPAINQFGPGFELSTYEAYILDCPGAPVCADGRPVFGLDLCHWTQPPNEGAPYASQHHVGIVRLGLAVTDLDTACAHLAARGTAVSAPEQRDFGPEVGKRTAVVARDPDDVMVELFDRPL